MKVFIQNPFVQNNVQSSMGICKKKNSSQGFHTTNALSTYHENHSEEGVKLLL